MKVAILSGSVYGTAEDVARHAERQLKAAGFDAWHDPRAQLQQSIRKPVERSLPLPPLRCISWRMKVSSSLLSMVSSAIADTLGRRRPSLDLASRSWPLSPATGMAAFIVAIGPSIACAKFSSVSLVLPGCASQCGDCGIMRGFELPRSAA